MGSFEQWSSVVRDALIWLRCADPVTSMEIICSKDPGRNAMQALMAQWRQTFGTDIVTVAKMIEAAEKKAADIPGDNAPATKGDPAFKEALIEIASSGGKISGRSLGKWLARNQDKIVEKEPKMLIPIDRYG